MNYRTVRDYCSTLPALESAWDGAELRVEGHPLVTSVGAGSDNEEGRLQAVRHANDQLECRVGWESGVATWHPAAQLSIV